LKAKVSFGYDEELTVITERVDDIPLLLAQQERMGIAE